MSDSSRKRADCANVQTPVSKCQDGIEAEKVFFSSTLKRNPKIDMSKADLLQLLSCLEGELQARDVVIASLKMEQVKHMLSRAKYGWSDVSDPVTALQRDSDLVKDSESEDAAIRGIYGNQLMQLERLINTQRVAQQQMRDQLVAVEKQYHRTCAELDDVKRKHAGEIELAENVTVMLEKDRDHYKQEAELHLARCKQMDGDLMAAAENRHEDQNTVARHRQVALMLLRERSRLILKLLEARERSAEFERTLKEEREKSSLVEENLERQVAECEQLCSRLASAESLNRSLQSELDSLRSAAATGLTVKSGTADADSLSRPAQSHFATSSVSVSGSDGRNTPDRSSPNIQVDAGPKLMRNSGMTALADAAASRSNDRWATPINRNIAAARLRSVLSAAIEGSAQSPAAGAASTRLPTASSQDSPSTYQQSLGSPGVATRGSASGNKLPLVPSPSQSASFAGSHSVHRSVVLPPAAVPAQSQYLSDSKVSGRLTPLVPISPRLTPLAVSPSQTNGTISFPVRDSSLALKPLNHNSSK